MHPDYSGVLIVQPYGLETGHYDIMNALFSDLSISKFGNPMPIRSKDKIFHKKKNKRLSAVVYCKKRLNASGYIREKIIYHNPYAKTKLAASVFGGENVTQFMVIQHDDGKLFYGKVTE